MKTFFTAIYAMAKAQIIRVFRDKGALFFTFLFPLIFLFVFGSLNRGNNDIKFTVAVLDHSNGAFSKSIVDKTVESGILKVDDTITSLDDAKTQMGQGKIDSVLEFPSTFGDPDKNGQPSGGLNVYYQEGNPQAGQTLSSIMQGIFDGINEQSTGFSRPFTTVPLAATTSNLTSFDYIFAGLLGYSILSMGIYGMATTFPSYKKSGLLRRIRVAPVNAAQLVIATGIRYLFTGLMSLALMTIVAVKFFEFSMKGSYINLLFFAIFSIVMIFGLGLAIGGWAKNEDQAQPLANLVAFPLMFLSGVFFPRFLMPEWLQKITGYLPLSPIVDGFRAITSEGANFLGLGHELLLMTVWTIVIYGLATLLFRWE